MTIALYAIYDIKAQAIVGNIITLHRSVASAIRMYSDALGNTQSEIGRHPEDYNLISLGEINDADPQIEGSLPHIDTWADGAELVMTGSIWKANRDAADHAGRPELVKEA